VKIRLLFLLLLLTACAATYGEQYIVSPGESIESISRDRGVSSNLVREMNYLRSEDKVAAGDIIFLPASSGEIKSEKPVKKAATKSYAAPKSRPTTKPSPKIAKVDKAPVKHKPQKSASPKKASAKPMKVSNSGFQWPLTGKVLCEFGDGGGKGIEIESASGKSVLSAAKGKVSYAGLPARAYGHMVIVDHGADRYTVYSNLKSLEIKAGQKVARGEVLGTVSDFLHFEVRDKGSARDPLLYLPSR